MSNSSTAKKHAEYKVPGGKLLVIDLTVSQGKLLNVQLSGDFFMEPPEALDVINDTLEAMSIDIPDAQIKQSLQTALGDSVSLYGITVDGVVEVVKRALA